MTPRGRPDFTYYVTTEPASYGDDVTVEQAQTIAEYIAARLTEYAEQKGYNATIKVVSHVGGQYTRAVDAAGEHATEDMHEYLIANWGAWVGEALE